MALIPFDSRDGYIWFDGRLVPWREARIHILTHGLHYGSSVFDGERAYDGKIFKSREHSERLIRSGALLDFAVPYSADEIETAKSAVLDANGAGDQYVRSFAWRGSEMMAVSAQQSSIHVAVATWNWPSLFNPEEKMRGIRLGLAPYRRPDPACAPVQSKAAGLYMIATLSKHAVERVGCADALMLDWQGRVAECTGANIFFVADGVLHTPIADCFLNGITRQTVIDIAHSAGIEVSERRIMPDELSTFSECFLCGTAAEITPVSAIDQVTFAAGAITRKIMELYGVLVRGG